MNRCCNNLRLRGKEGIGKRRKVGGGIGRYRECVFGILVDVSFLVVRVSREYC